MMKNQNIKTEGPERSRRVVVAMSGGVDSSVAAALLKKAGFDVVGIFMKFWSAQSTPHNVADKKDANKCCSMESEKLARLVAKKIGIPFYVLNVEKEFKKKVVDYFLKEYKAGKTPNPCVVCNKKIKFGLLVERALKLGADFVATGHYIKTSLPGEFFLRGEPLCGAPSSRKNSPVRLIKLLQSKDKEKDQSYFLWQLNQKQLSHVLFPVGGYTKPEVRKLAKKFKLPTAETPESQEVCFIKDTTNDFLKKYLKTKPGKITNVAGKVVGEHKGLWFYTIGQRKGLGVNQGPYYVVDKDFKKNILIVSKNEKDLEKKELIAKNINWICPPEFSAKQKFWRVNTKIRYGSKGVPATISMFGKNKARIIFERPQMAITPGQSVVFYRGEELLGGGVIE